MKQDRKYHYDEHNGVFVFEDEISINWLLSQVLNQKNLQITKVSNEQLHNFLESLSNSDLRMPNGQYCLFWLKEQIKEKMQLADAKLGQAWHDNVIRYRYILELIDVKLSQTKDLHDKMDIRIEQPKLNINRELNNMQAYFEPLDDQSSNP